MCDGHRQVLDCGQVLAHGAIAFCWLYTPYATLVPVSVSACVFVLSGGGVRIERACRGWGLWSQRRDREEDSSREEPPWEDFWLNWFYGSTLVSFWVTPYFSFHPHTSTQIWASSLLSTALYFQQTSLPEKKDWSMRWCASALHSWVEAKQNQMRSWWQIWSYSVIKNMRWIYRLFPYEQNYISKIRWVKGKVENPARTNAGSFVLEHASWFLNNLRWFIRW